MMGREENVYIVCVEHLGKLLVHIINFHFWAEWKSLNKEHGVFKSLNIGVTSCFPDDFHNLLESAWNETTVWNNFNWDWSRSVNEESDWALFARVRDSELRDQVAFEILKIELLVSSVDVNEMGTDIDC